MPDFISLIRRTVTNNSSFLHANWGVVRLTHWHPEAFLAKTHILDILEIFRLDKPKISSNLLKKALPWITTCSGRNFCSEFSLSLLAFSGIVQAPLSQSPWPGYHWNDVFLLHKLRIDDANFGQRYWRQKWNKGQWSSRAITGGKGVN